MITTKMYNKKKQFDSTCFYMKQFDSRCEKTHLPILSVKVGPYFAGLAISRPFPIALLSQQDGVLVV